jgi:signal transduction histidine kinase
VPAHDGLSVVAASAHQAEGALFAFATFTAAAIASIAAWLIGMRLARRAVRPLTRLQARIAALRLERAAPDGSRVADLGPNEGVREIDELRLAMSIALRRMHDALDRATRFAANAAHEIRTPLTVLRTELELLAEHEGDNAAAARAVRKVEQIHALTERLLVLALPEANVEAKSALVSIRDVIDEAVANLPADQRARVAFLGENDVVIRGDEAELGIVVSNGLSNALKFGTRVVVELEVTSGRAILAIDDDGPGVTEGERESMFAPFTRGPGSQGMPGHGLGLALVAHVARRHGGEARLVASRAHAHGARLEIVLVVAAESVA